MAYPYSDPAPASDEELWEVIVAPDDVKLLTLEQLDDAFRLDVIDVSTLVRQRGTTTWQRLGVVAGIESESESESSAADWDEDATAIVPTFAARPKAGPSQAPSFAAQAHPFWNPGAAPQVLPLLDQPLTPPPPAPTPPPPKPPAPASFAPAPLAQPTFESLALAEAEPVIQRPAFTSDDFKRPAVSRRSRTSFWLLLIASLVGAVWAGHRNDALRAGARRLGLEAKYLAFEKSSLGVPGFGTPRQLEAFFAEIGEPISDAASASATPEPTASPAPPVATSEPRGPAKSAEATEAPSSDPSQPVSLDSLPLLGPEPAREAASAPAPRSAAASTRSDTSSAQRAAPAAKARPEKVQLDEAPAKPSKPEDPLKAAIRSAIEKQNKGK